MLKVWTDARRWSTSQHTNDTLKLPKSTPNKTESPGNFPNTTAMLYRHSPHQVSLAELLKTMQAQQAELAQLRGKMEAQEAELQKLQRG